MHDLTYTYIENAFIDSDFRVSYNSEIIIYEPESIIHQLNSSQINTPSLYPMRFLV